MFLNKQDYYQLITFEDYNDVFNDKNDRLRLRLEASAQEFISTYTRQRYDVTKIFIEVISYSDTKAFVVGDVVIYVDVVYTCIADSTGNKPINVNYFSKTDPRNQLIVTTMVDIVLYNAHSLIVPNNVPTVRRIRYNSDSQVRKMDGSAIGTLMAIQNGDIMIDLPIYEDPQRGQNITYGSNLKRNNTY